MKKICVISIIFLLLITILLPASAKDTNKDKGNNKVILYGGVQTTVPKTPDEVTAYLIKMKAIMKEYETLSNQLLTVLMSGNVTPNSADSAINEWTRLANKIDSLMPPTELTASHKQLASALRRSSAFLSSSTTLSTEQKQQLLTSMVPVVSDLANSAMAYQKGVSIVINKMGLDPSLNPLGTGDSLNASGTLNFGNFLPNLNF